ncbi:hypothetical protein PoB_002463700 [Plakobranchus ocellatus]|uniref:Uncharacterized protein n=1 Tax=Plakobranchus ocellatus TaxID=259542 RepID=A0AAV3ZSK1_9GAST|nr:hypothetical protein PoB_002463700 [Plakobranchus ocellatus]
MTGAIVIPLTDDGDKDGGIHDPDTDGVCHSDTFHRLADPETAGVCHSDTFHRLADPETAGVCHSDSDTFHRQADPDTADQQKCRYDEVFFNPHPKTLTYRLTELSHNIHNTVSNFPATIAVNAKNDDDDDDDDDDDSGGNQL